MPSVLVPIADGSEEIETTCIVDTLVRAGAEVTLASVGPALQVKCSRGVKIVADVMMADVATREFDCIAVPGGMPGATHIAGSAPFMSALRAHAAAGKVVGAICAAPAVVLLPAGLIPAGAAATCHPAFASKLEACSEERVVRVRPPRAQPYPPSRLSSWAVGGFGGGGSAAALLHTPASWCGRWSRASSSRRAGRARRSSLRSRWSHFCSMRRRRPRLRARCSPSDEVKR